MTSQLSVLAGGLSFKKAKSYYYTLSQNHLPVNSVHDVIYEWPFMSGFISTGN